MKTLHKFIVKSYLGPFVLTFCIALFILVMQFLWKYIDDMVGKGLEWHIIARLLIYASATLVPMALPLAILLSSIMTFGNLAEHYELVSMKSAGLSLIKIMRPLIITSVIISLVAFFFSNNALPYAKLKMGALLYDVRESKPAFNLKAGVFYNGIDGFSIRVGEKGKDGKTLSDIMIYDHTDYQGNNKMIVARKGYMEMSKNKQYLILTLHDGYSYQEPLSAERDFRTRPIYRNKFEEEIIQLDLSGFKLERTDEELFKDNYQMLNIKDLEAAIDSLKAYKNSKFNKLTMQLHSYGYARTYNRMKVNDSLKISGSLVPKNTFFQNNKARIYEIAANIARTSKSYIEVSIDELKETDTMIVRHEVEWHKKLTLSFACLVLFFIGAPLGAIIRKGGLGMPVVVSVFFFIFFHILSITGEKFAKEGVMPAYSGMWMASAILLPIGIFLTYKAAADSSLFDIESYLAPIKKIFKGKDNK